MSVIKKFLRKFLPPPAQTFLRETKGLHKLIKNLFAKLNAQLAKMEQKLSKLSKQLTDHNSRQQKQYSALEKRLAEMEKQLIASNDQLEHIQTRLKSIDAHAASASRHSAEAVWAEIYGHTTSGSTWLIDNAVSAGRWAMGYPGLYALYRILNETHPQRILELGLGQTTRMIGQYVAANPSAEHWVIEHDPQWISFFENTVSVSERTQIVQLEREMRPYKEAEAVRCFKGFEDAIKGKKFDFIVIDAPLGAKMNHYSRIDVLLMMPDCLSESFIIMLDDENRIGEQHTAAEMEAKLKACNIAYSKGRYSGDKNTLVLASADKKFVCSM